MRISDLDYLESLSETHAMQLNGGGASAISQFLAQTFGNSTNTNAIVRNLAISAPDDNSIAISFVKETSIASGGNTFASASTSSYSAVR